MEEKAKIPMLKAALTYGAILGLASIVIALLFYFMGQTYEKWAMIVTPIIFFGLIVVMLILFRNEYGKVELAYGKIVLMGLLLTLFSQVLTVPFSYVLMSVDEGFLTDTKYEYVAQVEKGSEKAVKMIQKLVPESEQDEAIDEMYKEIDRQKQKMLERSAFYFAASGVINVLFMGTLIGLIAGAFLKKKPKIAE